MVYGQEIKGERPWFMSKRSRVRGHGLWVRDQG